MTIFIIWLVGYVLAYFCGRYVIRSYYIKYNSTYDYSDVIGNLTLSILSYAWVIIILYIHLTEIEFFKKEPPKWL